MSVLSPVILSELVNNREEIGSLKLAIAAPSNGKYLACDGSVKNTADYPQLAELLPAVMGEASLIDITNTRPLDSSEKTNYNTFINGSRIFSQVGNILYTIDNGIQLSSYSLPDSSTIEAFEAHGDVIFCRTATRVGKSSDNGITWFWSAQTFSNFTQSFIRGEFKGSDYNSSTDTFIFVTANAVYKMQGTTITGYASYNPANLISYSSTAILYKGVFFDSDTGIWYIVGGVQQTSSTASWSHFVIKSADAGVTWSTAFQEKHGYYGNSRTLDRITKVDGIFYMLSGHAATANGSTGKLYITTDFVTVGGTSYNGTDGIAVDNTLIPINNSLYVLGTSGQKQLRKISKTTAQTYPTWTMVKCGTSHQIGIQTNGTLWAWGSNQYGQLGTDSTVGTIDPVQVGTDTDWIYCSAGSYSSAAIKSDGSLWVWGSNSLSQLGLGDTVNRLTPTKIPGTTIWTKVELSGNTNGVTSTTYEDFMLAIASDGFIYASGKYPVPSTGALGTATTLTLIQNSRQYIDVFAYSGWDDSASLVVYAIAADRTMYSWGNTIYTTSGIWGRGSTAASIAIGQVGTTQSWKKVSANIDGSLSGTATYSYVLALTTDGELWAWGANQFGYLGDGSQTNRTSPVRVGTKSDWVDILATCQTVLGNGYEYRTSYAVDSLGDVYIFGTNAYRSDWSAAPARTTTASVTSTPTLIRAGTDIKQFVELKRDAGYGSSSTIGLTILMLDSNGRLMGVGREDKLGIGPSSKYTVSPELLAFGVSSSLELDLSAMAESVAYTKNNTDEVHASIYSSNIASINTSRYIIKDTSIAESSSIFGINSYPELLYNTGSTYKLYRQIYGSYQFYSDYLDQNTPPLILDYSTLTNIASQDNTSNDQVAFSTKQRYIYSTVDGITWNRSGVNPLIAGTTSGVLGPILFNSKYWMAGRLSGGLWNTIQSNLYRWQYSNVGNTGTDFLQFATNSQCMVLASAGTAGYVTYTGASNAFTSIVLPGTSSTNCIAASENEWMFRSTIGDLYIANTPVITASTVWSLVTNLSNIINFGYKDGIWVAATATQIFYSSNGGLEWTSAYIDTSNLGVLNIGVNPITVANGVFVLTTNSDSALISSDGASWKRYKKPQSVSANSFTYSLDVPSGGSVIMDETNLRSLLLTPGPYDETSFVLPKLQNADGITYYVRAK